MQMRGSHTGFYLELRGVSPKNRGMHCMHCFYCQNISSESTVKLQKLQRVQHHHNYTLHFALQSSSQYLCFKNPVRNFYSFPTDDLFYFLGTIAHIVFLLQSFHFDVLALTTRGNVVDQKRSIAVVQLHCKQQVQQLLQESRSFSCSFSGMKEGDVATYFSGKSETQETKIKTQFEVFPLFVKSLNMQNKEHVNTVL